MLELAQIQLAEDFLSVRVLEFGPCNLEIHEIYIILVESVGFVGFQMNKLLSGEFRVFRGKMIIIGFGHCRGNLAVK